MPLKEVLRIAKEFHDSIMDMVKQKWLSIESEPKKSVEV